jgi:hypothetical protein
LRTTQMSSRSHLVMMISQETWGIWMNLMV